MNSGAATGVRTSLRAMTTPVTLEQAAKDYRDLQVAVSTKRQITKGAQFANLSFQSVDGRVLRAAMITQNHPMFYTWHTGELEMRASEITLSLGIATEAELIAARSMVSPAQAGQIDVLLKLVRDGEQPEKPLRVEIVNANELAPATKVAAVKRGDDGKVSGLIVESIVTK